MIFLKNIYKKFIQLSPVAKTSLVLIAAKFFQKGLAFISAPIFTRIMPSAEYGVISTFTSWQSILYIIATLNMSSGVFNNGMHEFKEDRDGFTMSILVLANLCTLVCLGIYFLFYSSLNKLFDMPGILMVVMLLYFWFAPAYNYWLGRNRFEYKYKAVFIVMAIAALLSTFFSVALVLIAPENQKAIVKVVTAETVEIILGSIIYIYIFVKAKFRLNIQYWGYALKINLPLVLHYLSMHVLSSSDRIMITKLVNSSATAIYNVAYTVAAVMLIFWNAVDAAYAPWIYEKMERRDYKSLQRRAQDFILLFASIAVFVILFAPEIIRILGPEEYYEGAYIIPAVVASVFITAIYSFYIRVELYLKKSSAVMIATVISAVLNLGLNYICIPLFGYAAAGYTTLICYIFLAVFHAANLNRMGYGDVYNNKLFAIIGTIVGVFIILLSIFYKYTIARYLLIIILLTILIKKRHIIVDKIKEIRQR